MVKDDKNAFEEFKKQVEALKIQVDELTLNTVSKVDFTAMIALEEKTNANLESQIKGLSLEINWLTTNATTLRKRIDKLVGSLQMTGDLLNGKIADVNSKVDEQAVMIKSLEAYGRGAAY